MESKPVPQLVQPEDEQLVQPLPQLWHELTSLIIVLYVPSGHTASSLITQSPEIKVNLAVSQERQEYVF